MAGVFSKLKLQLMETGENSGTWGQVTNVNLGTAIEEAITGSADVVFSNTDVTLPFIDTNETQAARNLRLNLIGTSDANHNLIVPNITKVYIINNGLANVVTVKNATGTGVEVPPGKTTYVYNNGTSVVDAITYLTSLDAKTLYYSGTLTGGTGVINIGSGQIFKDTAGNVGIGTPTPISTLHVRTGPGGGVRIDGESGGNRNLSFSSNGSNRFIVAGANSTAESGGNAGSDFTIFRYSDASGFLGEALKITRSNGAVNIGVRGTAQSPAVRFSTDTSSGIFSPGVGLFAVSTNGGERLRIEVGGNLLVGTSTSGGVGGLSIIPNGSGPAGAAAATVVWNRNNSTGASTVALFRNAGSDAGAISYTATTTTYATSSDYRLKNIEGAITDSGAYIDSLKPVHGSWKVDGSKFVGLIAHEAQEVSQTPVATGEKDGDEMQGMDYSASEIIANLIAEIQSLRTRVAQLEGSK